MNKIEELKFYQKVKTLYLEVIKVGLKHFENSEIKIITEEIIKNYKIFNAKFLC